MSKASGRFKPGTRTKVIENVPLELCEQFDALARKNGFDTRAFMIVIMREAVEKDALSKEGQ